MAKKGRSKRKTLHKRQQQRMHRPAQRLRDAEAALTDGTWEVAADKAEQALTSGNDPATIQKAKQIAAEALFQQAARATTNAECVRLLQRALTHAPEQERLSYQLALAEWRRAAPVAADAALETVNSTAAAAAGQPANLNYVVQLTNLAVGKEVRYQELSTAEENSLRLLARFKAETATAETLPAVTEPILGDTALWSLLLQMYASTTSIPVTSYQKALAAVDAPNPIYLYYAGVVAMRNGDSATALEAWQAAAQRVDTPWLRENLHIARREQATALADQGKWQAVVDLHAESCAEVGREGVDAAFNEMAGHAYFHLGFAAGQQGKWPEAHKLFKAASEFIKSRLLSQNLALTSEQLEMWREAAEAWREMVRRRPRKATHADYLTDQQVAAIWEHAAHCYEQIQDSAEAIVCLKNAIKYNESNVPLRLRLVDLYEDEERIDAAENELWRILEIDEDNVPALIRLAASQSQYYGDKGFPLWKRALALEPNNEDARMGLARWYLDHAELPHIYQAVSGNRKQQTPLEILLAGLEDVPEHPLLLADIGLDYRYADAPEKACEYFQRAAEADPRNPHLLELVLHELLHVNGDEIVRHLVPMVRQIQGLRPYFWVDQGARVLHCELDEAWAHFFWEIAVEVAQPLQGADSPAAVLLSIVEEALDFNATDLVARYKDLLTENHARSGAPEYVQALLLQQQNPAQEATIRAHLRKAKHAAKKANESAIVERATAFERELEMGELFPFDASHPLSHFFADLDELDIDEETIFDAFRKQFR